MKLGDCGSWKPRFWILGHLNEKSCCHSPTLRSENGGMGSAKLIPPFNVKREASWGENFSGYVHYDNHVNLSRCQFVQNNEFIKENNTGPISRGSSLNLHVRDSSYPKERMISSLSFTVKVDDQNTASVQCRLSHNDFIMVTGSFLVNPTIAVTLVTVGRCFFQA